MKVVKNLRITPLVSYSIVLLFTFVANGAFSIILPIHLTNFGLSYSAIGAVVASFGLGIAVVKLFLARFSDVVGRKSFVVFPLFFLSLLNVLLIFTHNFQHVLIIVVLNGFARGLFSIVRAPLIKDLSEERNRGKVYGMVTACSTAGEALGGVVGGFLYYKEFYWLFFSALSMLYIIGGIVSILGIPGFVGYNLVVFVVFLFVFMSIFSFQSPLFEKIESISTRSDFSAFDFAVLSFSVTVGTASGNFLFGKLIDSFGPGSAFIALIIGYAFMCAICFMALFVRRNQIECFFTEL